MKNVLFWVGVKSKDPLLKKKHGNFDYLDLSKNSWKYWREKNDVYFYEYDTPSDNDTGKHLVTWQRWFDIFDQLDSAEIDYNKVALIDGSTIVKWNAPNFFDEVSNNLTAFRSLENIKWIYQGVQGYKDLFNGFDFKLQKYIDCGFQIFDKSHKKFLDNLKEYYYSNYDSIMYLQKTVKRGTDQAVYNYLLQIENITVDTELNPAFNLNHLQRFDWLHYNWQLKEDTTPFFIKYGYIWKFSGFDRAQRYNLMKQTWNLVKHNYEN